MLARPLHLLEATFPSDSPTISEDQWNLNQALFCHELSRLVRELSGIVKLSIPRRVFVECKEEMVVTKSSGISVCEFRIRPPTSYYDQTAQPVPAPENRTGSHSTGLKLAFSLFRGFVTRKATHPACLSVEFQVWGVQERLSFKALLNDHRWLVQKLIGLADPKFYTSCVFDNVERYKGNSAFQRLELYFQNEIDDESLFSLEKAFGPESTVTELVAFLLPLIALYDSAYGYCIPRQEKSRIQAYTPLVMKTRT
jgi:hypothetical protein